MKNPFKGLFEKKEPNFIDPSLNNIFSATPIFDAAKAHNDMADALRAGLVTPEEYKKRVFGEPSCLAKLNQQNSSGAVDEIKRQQRQKQSLAGVRTMRANLPYNKDCVVLQIDTELSNPVAFDNNSINITVKMRMSEKFFENLFHGKQSTQDKMDQLLEILKNKGA